MTIPFGRKTGIIFFNREQTHKDKEVGDLFYKTLRIVLSGSILDFSTSHSFRSPDSLSAIVSPGCSEAFNSSKSSQLRLKSV